MPAGVKLDADDMLAYEILGTGFGPAHVLRFFLHGLDVFSLFS